MSKVKALILDAGGVMVRPLHGDWNVPARYRELLGDYARDVSGEAWREACRAEAHIVREDVYVQGMQVERGLRREFFRKVAERMGWALSDQTLDALAEDIIEGFKTLVPLYHYFNKIVALTPQQERTRGEDA